MNPPNVFDPIAYLARLGWEVPAPRAMLTDLSKLLRAHMLAIPFENLDVLRGLTPRLDLASVQAKMVAQRRGGYCFEHGVLFGAALTQFGFQTRHGVARVTLARPREQAPRTHHILVVTLEGRDWLVDPGFGGLAPEFPVPFDSAHEGQGPFRHRLVRQGAYWQLQAQVDGSPVALWSSELEDAYPVDYELGNHYTATHPDSIFVQHLMLRALTPDGRVSVLDRDATWRAGAHARRWTLADRAELDRLLKAHFAIDLPDVERLRVPAVPEWATLTQT